MKTTFRIIIRAARCSFGAALCAGAIVFIAPTGRTQNLFGSSGSTIYQFTPGGASSTFATVTGNAYSPAFDGEGDLFVGNTGNGTISEIAPNGTQSTFASGLRTPTALAFDREGDLFVSDIGTMAIYKFTPGGARSTFATGLYAPYGLAFNSTGNLFAVANSVIYRFTPNGAASVFASVPTEGLGGLAFNSTGDLFVTAGGDAGYIYKYGTDGVRSTFASGLDNPLSLAFNSAGDLFVSDFVGIPIYEFTQDGERSAFFSDQSVGVIGLAFQGEILPVPEPSVSALLAAGITLLFVRRKSIQESLAEAFSSWPNPRQ